MRTDAERLDDILEAITTVGNHAVSSWEIYEADEVKRWFFLKQVEIIGEAAWKTSPELQMANPDVPWKRIAGMRHILVHDYWEVDWDLLWRVVSEELEPLRQKIERILHDSGEV